jgi:hypothetical protein
MLVRVVIFPVFALLYSRRINGAAAPTNELINRETQFKFAQANSHLIMHYALSIMN